MRYILLTLFFISAPLVAQPAKQDRYQDFVFEPQYSDTAAESIVKTYLLSEKNTLNWHELKKGNAVEVGDNYWAAYEIGLKKEAVNAYYTFKDNAEFVEKRQLKKKEQAGWKGVSFFDANQKQHDISYKRTPKDQAEIWYPGSFWGSAFGCISNKPIFKVNLIEGKTPSVVVVSSMSDQVGINFVGDSFIRLSIFNGMTGELQAEEYPLLWSVVQSGESEKNIYSMSHYDYWKQYFGIEWGLGESKLFNPYKPKVPRTIQNIKNERSKWTDKEWNLASGRYQYTKLFADDLDEDGKLELLFWHKRYRANDKKDGLGFFLEKDYFTLYKENQAGSGFVKSRLDKEAGIALLDLKKKSWNDGWPNDDHLCSNKMQSDPRSKRGLTEDELVSPVNLYQGD